MSPRRLPISNTMHQPKLMQQQTVSFHNQASPTITFGGITHHITPESLHSVSTFKAPKANSYSQPILPANNKEAASKQANSEKFSAPRVQQDAFPLTNNSNHTPANRDAVSKWLATSQEFEKPPAPAPVAESTLPERRCREYWLEISQDLDSRLKVPKIIVPRRAYADPVFDRRFELDLLKIEKEKLTPPNQRNTGEDLASTPSPVAMAPLMKLESERKKLIEASISAFEEKLEKRKQGPRLHEQLERVKENKADDHVKVTKKLLEVAKSRDAEDAVRAKEKEEQLKAAESKKADDAVTVRVKAKKLAADAMARHKEAATYFEDL